MDDIFGSDDEEAPAPSAAPPPIDYASLWSDYSTWEADIEDRSSRSLSDLETDFKFGRGISAEAYTAEKSRLEAERSAEMRSLQSGPTYQMLRENYVASGTNADMTSFYGGPAQRTPETGQDSLVKSERGASPKRGIKSGLPEAEAAGLLDRQQATWFYV